VKAVVCSAPGDVRVEELDDPSPRAGEVKVAVVAVGVCHTLDDAPQALDDLRHGRTTRRVFVVDPARSGVGR
jgi:NADPH:quinone reductase-like Zn-dependent oxidoreductase